jgi:hypothetical protein
MCAESTFELQPGYDSSLQLLLARAEISQSQTILMSNYTRLLATWEMRRGLLAGWIRMFDQHFHAALNAPARFILTARTGRFFKSAHFSRIRTSRIT